MAEAVASSASPDLACEMPAPVEPCPARSLPTTTISTIAVHSGSTRIVIALLQVKKKQKKKAKNVRTQPAGDDKATSWRRPEKKKLNRNRDELCWQEKAKVSLLSPTENLPKMIHFLGGIFCFKKSSSTTKQLKPSKAKG